MNMIRRVLFALSSACLASPAAAGAYSAWAVPTQVEYVSGGILISGAFGNPNDCTKNDLIFVAADPANEIAFNAILSMVLTALTSQKQLRFYSNECTAIASHWSGDAVSKSGYSRVYIRW